MVSFSTTTTATAAAAVPAPSARAVRPLDASQAAHFFLCVCVCGLRVGFVSAGLLLSLEKVGERRCGAGLYGLDTGLAMPPPAQLPGVLRLVQRAEERAVCVCVCCVGWAWV